MQKTNRNISSDDFIDYLSGAIKPDDVASFEKNVAADSFESEALSGFQTLDAAEAVQLIKDVNSKVRAKSGLPESNDGLKVLWRFLAVAATVVLVVGVVFWLSNSILESNKQDPEIAEASVPESKNSNKNNADYRVIGENQQPTDYMEFYKREAQLDEQDFEMAPQDEIALETEHKNAPLVEADEPTPVPVSDQNELLRRDRELLEEESRRMSPEREDVVEVATPQESNISITSKSNSSGSYIATADKARSVDANQNSYSEGLDLYHDKEYNEAAVKFEQSISKGEYVSSSKYYAGVSYYFAGKQRKAAKYLSKTINSNSKYKPNAQWYLALIKINQGDEKGGRDLLQELANGNSSFKNQAKDKLSKL